MIYHTSPAEIKKINKFGLFDDCLFFSVDVYQMSACECIVYQIDDSELSFIAAHELDDGDAINCIAAVLEVDTEQAERYLDARDDVQEDGFDYEMGYFIQAMRGAAAKNMGFDGCLDEDEQGSVYIIPMLERENLLKKIK